MRSHAVFRFGSPALLVVFALAAVTSIGTERRVRAKESGPTTIQLTKQSPDAGYVGEERCRSCHKAEVTEFHKTPHAGVAASGQPMNCESCHGAGKAHADAEEAAHGEDAATAAANKLIFAFRASPDENASRCLTCHRTQATQQDFAHSQHAGVGVSCQSCHSTHMVEALDRSLVRNPPTPQAQFSRPPRPDVERRWLAENLTKEAQPALCYTCHAKVRGQFAQPFHHRVPEGAMKCTDCHSTHGTNNRASLASPDWETCVKCHTDKHGPFLFEHAAVRVEGCAICHSPHGGVSRFMLNRRESRFLCLQCHGDPHSEQDQISVPHSRLGFQTRGDCTRCHVAIHGSNFSNVFLH